jgi:hypothetical protein
MNTLRTMGLGRLASALLLAIAGVVLAESAGWRDARFPGFFVMPNRVVPSVGLPGWNGLADGRPLYQQVVLSVDGEEAADSRAVYRLTARHQPGDDLEFTFARGGEIDRRTLSVQRLPSNDYLAIFGMYLLCGLCHLGLAVLASERRAAHPALGMAFAVLGWTSAAFSLTGMDLYGPGRFFRLHALAEAMLAAVTAHVALVCPRNRIAGRPGILPVLYGSAAALAAVYQVFLYEPAAYSVLHNVCQTLAALPVFALAVMLGLALADPPPSLGTVGTRWLLGGTLVGFVAPAIVLAVSGASGGMIPVNMSAWSAFVFPAGAAMALRSAARRRASDVDDPVSGLAASIS